MSLHQVAATENSKKKRKLTVEDLIGESSLVIEARRGAVDKMKKTADGVVNKGKEKTAPTRRRKRFISVKEFNQLV